MLRLMIGVILGLNLAVSLLLQDWGAALGWACAFSLNIAVFIEESR